ncbi:MAG: site-specific tyrosine recombinase XerD [Propionibacteriaceae bacterium]
MIISFLDHLVVERGASGHTVQAYQRDLHRYRDFLLEHGIGDPTAITTPVVTAFAADLRQPHGDAPDVRPGLAPASAARAVVAVRSLHRFAVEEGILSDDPAATVAPPRGGRRLPKALGLDAVQRLLAAPDQQTPTGLRDAALLELLYGTGARISEAVGLDVDDVARWVETSGPDPDEADRTDLDDGAALRLFGKGSKERIVPLGSYARRALAAYLVRGRPTFAGAGRGTPALFLNTRGARLSRQSAYAVLQASAARAGLSEAVSPHTLRHSFATHLLDGGADVRVVQELLGHASVTTTQIYTLVTVDHLREVYLTAHPRAR